MSDVILDILHRVQMGEGGYYTIKGITKTGLSPEEAAQQIKDWVDREIIGEDEVDPVLDDDWCGRWEVRNALRAEQRKKLK